MWRDSDLRLKSLRPEGVAEADRVVVQDLASVIRVGGRALDKLRQELGELGRWGCVVASGGVLDEVEGLRATGDDGL